MLMMTVAPDKTMVGFVRELRGRYFAVECPDAPMHLKHLDLVHGQMNGADVGDMVRLNYHSTPSSGAWVVSGVMQKAKPKS